MITTLEQAAPRDGKGPWYRGLEAPEKEYDRLPIRRVEGTLPHELRGVLFRNGPGQSEVYGKRNGHWFDGDGMIAAYRLDGESVTYSNRFIRTKYFEKEAKEKRMIYGGFATPAPSPFPMNLLRGMKNPANTNVLEHNGKLLALWEGGRPWSLDPETLTTLGEESFDGTLPRGSFFSAHPHRDQKTGGFVNVGSIMGAKPGVQPWYVSPEGKAKRLSPITLDKAYMVHDFGLTASKIVILGGPFYVEPKRLFNFIFRGGTIFDCFAWHPEEAMVLYVADRDGKEKVRRYELPAAMLFHVANAYDQGDDVIVDAMLYDDDSALQIVADGFAGRRPTANPGKLWRIRLSPNGKVTREPLCDLGVDFARINERHDSLRYRYAYPLVFEKGDFSSSKIAKIDVVTGNTVVHDFGAGCYAGEPVFVAKPGSSREDEGWVLSVVYDSRDHHSFLAVVPSEGFGQEDVRAHLPFHTPLGFHGNWSAA